MSNIDNWKCWKKWVKLEKSLGYPNVDKVCLEKQDLIMDEILESNHPTQEEIISFNIKEAKKNEMIDHPNHYGGESNPYESIKVIEAWGLGFNLGNTIKYVSRAGKKLDMLEDLKKASWYINREIKKLKK